MSVMPLPYDEARKVTGQMRDVSIGFRRPGARTLRRRGLCRETYGRWWAIWAPYTPEWCKREYWNIVRMKEAKISERKDRL